VPEAFVRPSRRQCRLTPAPPRNTRGRQLTNPFSACRAQSFLAYWSSRWALHNSQKLASTAINKEEFTSDSRQENCIMKHKKIIFFIAGLLFFSLMFFFIVQLFTAHNRARTGFITSMPRSPLQIIFVTAAPHVDELLPTMLPITATELTDSNGVAMVLIPAGEFSMGTNNGDPDEKPVATINLGAFYIDKYEVTNAFYEQCVNAGVCKPPISKNSQTHASYYGNPDFGDYPVTYVNWYM
jgi:hypothetical protein